MVFALKKFHYFVYGLEVVVRTDHMPLRSLFQRTNVSGRVLCWALKMQQYHVKIEYVKERANTVADALSRGVCATEEEAAPCCAENERVVCVVQENSASDQATPRTEAAGVSGLRN